MGRAGCVGGCGGLIAGGEERTKGEERSRVAKDELQWNHRKASGRGNVMLTFKP